MQTYTAHGREILDIAVSSDNARFASVGGDKLVFLWDVATAKTIRRFEGHTGRVEGVAFGGEGDAVLVSGGWDATVRVWDTKGSGWKPLMTLTEARDSVSCVKVLGWEIVAASVDGRVRGWDIRMGKCVVDVVGYPITSITPTTHNPPSLLLSTLDSHLRLFDHSTGTLLRAYTHPSFKNTEYRLRSALGLYDSTVFSGSENGKIFVWDLLEGTLLHELRHDEAAKEGVSGVKKKDVVGAVAWCPSEGKREWCSAGGDGCVVVWGEG